MVSVAYILALGTCKGAGSLVLAGLAASDCDLSLLQYCMSVLLGHQFSQGGIWIRRAMAQGQFQGADRNRKDPVPGCSLVLVSWWIWVGPSWPQVLGDLLSLSGIWVWRAAAKEQLWALGKPEGSCPRLLLGSCVLRVLGGSL